MAICFSFFFILCTGFLFSVFYFLLVLVALFLLVAFFKNVVVFYCHIAFNTETFEADRKLSRRNL